MWELDTRFHTPGWAEKRLKELQQMKWQKHEEGSSALPPNTLTNADGTPYAAEPIDGTNHAFFDAIRAIVREELEAIKAELTKDLLKKLTTEMRLQAGVISMNEARELKGL